jgi:hypothetical protein
MHGYIHKCIHTHRHKHTHACIQAYTNAYIHTDTHTYITPCMDMHIHACMHACMRMYVCMCRRCGPAHACIQAYINAYTHIHTYLHAWIYTHIPPCMDIYIHACMHSTEHASKPSFCCWFLGFFHRRARSAMDQQSIDTEKKQIPAETPRKRSRLLPKLASLAIQHADLLV